MTEYSNKWLSFTLIPVGGNWAYAVGRLENGNIRIAKGRQSAAKEQSGAPISQNMKLNIKPKDSAQWEQIKAEVDALLYVEPALEEADDAA